MPNNDRTGPNGEGPRTGRQMGKCNPDHSTQEKEKTENDSIDQSPHRFREGSGDGKGKSLSGGKGLGRGGGRGLGRGLGNSNN